MDRNDVRNKYNDFLHLPLPYKKGSENLIITRKYSVL